jgi:hypothetical protein
MKPSRHTVAISKNFRIAGLALSAEGFCEHHNFAETVDLGELADHAQLADLHMPDGDDTTDATVLSFAQRYGRLSVESVEQYLRRTPLDPGQYYPLTRTGQEFTGAWQLHFSNETLEFALCGWTPRARGFLRCLYAAIGAGTAYARYDHVSTDHLKFSCLYVDLPQFDVAA